MKDKQFEVVADCTAILLTFGGQQVRTMFKGDTFVYSSIFYRNDSYVIFQNGLNHYVFEAKGVPDDLPR